MSVTASDLLNGHSLRVVLASPVPGRRDANALVESLDLCHVVIDGERFWGKTASAGAPQGIPGDTAQTPYCGCAYAFCDDAGYVVHSSPLWDSCRLIASREFAPIEFVAIPDFRLVWEWGGTGDMTTLRAAIVSGRLIKVALLDHDNIWNIHPVHQPTIRNHEAYFELFTDDDAYPALLRSADAVARIAEASKDARETRAGPDIDSGSESSAIRLDGTVPYSAWHIIASDGRYLRGRPAARSESGYLGRRYRALKVFAEV